MVSKTKMEYETAEIKEGKLGERESNYTWVSGKYRASTNSLAVEPFRQYIVFRPLL